MLGEKYYPSTVNDQDRFNGHHHGLRLHHIRLQGGSDFCAREYDRSTSCASHVSSGGHLIYPARQSSEFKEYNARPIRNRVAIDCLRHQCVTTLSWPDKCLVGSRMEHVWNIQDRRVRNRPQHFVSSMLCRCSACIDAHGAGTRYCISYENEFHNVISSNIIGGSLKCCS